MTTFTLSSPTQPSPKLLPATFHTIFAFGRYLIAVFLCALLLAAQNGQAAHANSDSLVNPSNAQPLETLAVSETDNVTSSSDILWVGGIALVVLMLGSICALKLTQRDLSEQ